MACIAFSKVPGKERHHQVHQGFHRSLEKQGKGQIRQTSRGTTDSMGQRHQSRKSHYPRQGIHMGTLHEQDRQQHQ